MQGNMVIWQCGNVVIWQNTKYTHTSNPYAEYADKNAEYAK